MTRPKAIRPKAAPPKAARPVKVDLSAVIVTLEMQSGQARPMVLTPQGPQGRDLPTAAFDPDRHGTLHQALAEWVERHAGLRLDYIEQLYTFGDPRRSAARGAGEPHTVSIGYLALVRPDGTRVAGDWTPWALWFPWEDRRTGPPPVLAEVILPRLAAWAGGSAERRERLELSFGTGGHPWRDELTLERYELLYTAELVPETWADRGEVPPAGLPPSAPRRGATTGGSWRSPSGVCAAS